MKAPDKIYLQVCGDCKDNDCKNCKFEFLEDNVTWSKDKIFDKDIEYTCTDAFIEKAVKFLKPTVYVMCRGIQQDSDEYIKDFKNYMRGE